MLAHILKYKILSYFKTTFDRHTASIIRGTVSLCVFSGFAYGAYYFSFSATGFLLHDTRIGLFLFHAFISMMLYVFFVAVNLGNIIVLYATLYRSSEVNFLLTKPVSFTSIFLLKFLDNFFYSSTTLFVGACMMLIGYGRFFNYPWYFYFFSMFFVLIPFMFLAASLAVLILMAIMKFAGKIGFRKVLLGLFGVYFFLIYLFFKSSNPISLIENINHFIPNVDTYLINKMPGYLRYLPNQWVADFFYYVARGELINALPHAGILLIVTAAVFLACMITAQRFYYKSWTIALQMQSTAKQPYKLTHKKFLDFRSKSLLPPQVEVLVKKEIFVFFREASQWIHLIVMIIMAVIFSLSISNLRLNLNVLDVQLLTYLILFAFGGFMVSSLALRFVFPMIGLEGQTFWVLRSSPIKESKILRVKFLLGFILVFIVAEYIFISSNIPFVRMTEMRPLLLWFGVLSAFCLSFTTVSLNLGLGGYFANYNERNPIRVASSQGATITFLVTLVYLVMLVAIVYLPIYSYFMMLFQFKFFNTQIIVMPGTLITVISYLVSASFIFVGLKSIRRDF